jgi:hypothetical protein
MLEKNEKKFGTLKANFTEMLTIRCMPRPRRSENLPYLLYFIFICRYVRPLFERFVLNEIAYAYRLEPRYINMYRPIYIAYYEQRLSDV